MIDFPASPAIGQVFNTGTGSFYVWDGVAWSVATNATLTALSRNLIINPCGHVSQENGQTAGTVSGYFIADQWALSMVAASAAVSVKADGAVINPSGSTIRLLFKTTTAKAALAVGDYAGFYTKLEGVRVWPLNYLGAAPLQAVLRFGFNGPAGTYSVAIRNPTVYTVCWNGQFTITAAQANTDTTQVLVIPAPPTGYAWGAGGNQQIDMWFTFATGGTYTAPATGWQAGNFLAGPGQFNLLGTVNNQVTIWDIGLYADPNKTGVPPPFQVPDYSLDMMECQRYWRTWQAQQSCYAVGGTQTQILEYTGVGMRTSPTYTVIAAGTNSNITVIDLSVGTGPGYTSINLLLTCNASGMIACYNRVYSLNARM